VSEFIRALNILASAKEALTPRLATEHEVRLYTVQEYFDGSQLGTIPPAYLPPQFANQWAAGVWNGLQSVHASATVPNEPKLPRRLWRRTAWKHLKKAVQDCSEFDVTEMPFGTNLVLELASDYLIVTGGYLPNAETAVASPDEYVKLIRPLAKKFQKFVTRVLEGFTLYGTKAFLIPLFQSVSVETAAHEHTFHIESIALARAHSKTGSSIQEEQRLDSGCADVCYRLASVWLTEFSGRFAPVLCVCSKAMRFAFA